MTANSAAECLGVFNIFAGSVNSDPSIRSQAENQLKQVRMTTVRMQYIVILYIFRPVYKVASVRFFYK